ncbi:hypothetical protein [uncultured Tolumonas sp.]|uniref:hypothetical protein n=1 Tax=uncultured Tolumonas sp. TaxID=263765 RepID=UPI00292DFCB9|nr:hypothetical protein [uncultured Tolumonas sp.]
MKKEFKNTPNNDVASDATSSNNTPAWLVSSTKYYWAIRNKNSTTNTPTKIFFNKEIAPGMLLIDPPFNNLLLDLQRSYIYLYDEYIRNPTTLRTLHNNVISFIKHINEKRLTDGINLVIELNQITEGDFIDYIKTYSIPKKVSDEIIEKINANLYSYSLPDWDCIAKEFGLSSKALSYLKHKIINSRNESIYAPIHCSMREYEDADITRPIDEIHLPNNKTISNFTANLDLLYLSADVQVNKFTFSANKILLTANNSFSDFQSERKTSIIPLETVIHLISSAIQFCKNYGPYLLNVIKEFDKKELELRRNYTDSSSQVKDRVFNSIKIPKELEKLNINCFGLKNEDSDRIGYCKRNSMSLVSAISLYYAAIYILITAFIATRKISVLCLKRNCFSVSIIDDLYDVTFQQAKTEDKKISRPIPELIYDFGLNLVEFSAYLEKRKDIFIDDDEGYLFTKFGLKQELQRHKEHTQKIATGISEDTLQIYLNMFSDWCECPVHDDKRWYCKSHQLRRTFSVLYFNVTDNAGLEELAWQLGNTSLEVSFGYAEIHPDEEWLEEAKKFLAIHAKTIIENNMSSEELIDLIKESESVSLKINLQLERVVYNAINKRIAETGEEVHFKRLDNGNIYFYFSNGL